MDSKRISELSTLVTQTEHIPMADAQEMAEALAELASIKGAALPEKLREIESHHTCDAIMYADAIRDDGHIRRTHRDRATLLDALRAKEVESKQAGREAVIQWLETNRDEAIKMLSDETGALEKERDEARDQLAKLSRHATEERERLKGELEQARIDNHGAAMLVLAEEHVSIRKAIGLPGDCDPDDIVEHFEKLTHERDDLRAKLGQCAVSEETLREQLGEAQKEIERLQERCARDDAGVTIHECPPKGSGTMPCCGRPPFEVLADRMTTNPALVNCDRERLRAQLSQAERDKAALRDKIEGLTRLWVTNQGEEVEHETGHLLRRSEVLALLDKPLQGEGSAAAVPSEGEAEKARTADEWRPGLPPEALRAVWPAWLHRYREAGHDDTALSFRGSTYRFEWWSAEMPDRYIGSFLMWDSALLRPNGKTWAEVEALATHRDVKPEKV